MLTYNYFCRYKFQAIRYDDQSFRHKNHKLYNDSLFKDSRHCKPDIKLLGNTCFYFRLNNLFLSDFLYVSSLEFISSPFQFNSYNS